MPHARSKGRLANGRRLSAALLVVALPLAACAPQLDRTGLRTFADAAATVRRETGESFAHANRIGRVAAIDAFVRSGTPGLGAEAFPPAVPAEVAAAWDAALGDVVRYATLLGELGDAGRGAAVGDASAALGKELGGVTHARLGPPVAAGFALLAEALVEARAARRARDVLVRTDPDVQALVRAMVEALGTDDASGLRGTVWSSWTASFGTVRVDYAKAAAARDEAAQRRLAARYLRLVDQRDAEMRAFDHLVASLRTLAAAHAAASRAQPQAARALLAGMAAQAAEFRRLLALAGGDAP